MDLRARTDEAQGVGFQIAPMIDIVFVVLVFFVATYAVTQEEKLMSLNLPETTTGKTEYRHRQQILLNIDSRGDIFLEQRKLLPEVLERRLGQLVMFAGSDNSLPSVIIRADGECHHSKVLAVMDLCARAGIKTVHFSALQAKDK